MDETMGPLEYAVGSHKWSDGRVGSSRNFFKAKQSKSLLYSAAEMEGIQPQDIHIVSVAGIKAGGISIHDGRTWHGSGPNVSDKPRRGVGLHLVPACVEFTSDASKSTLWRKYVENVDFDQVSTVAVPESDFPTIYTK